jgi:hypothetical protein
MLSGREGLSRQIKLSFDWIGTKTKISFFSSDLISSKLNSSHKENYFVDI